MVSVIFVVVSTIAMVINTLPDLAGPPDEKVDCQSINRLIIQPTNHTINKNPTDNPTLYIGPRLLTLIS